MLNINNIDNRINTDEFKFIAGFGITYSFFHFIFNCEFDKKDSNFMLDVFLYAFAIVLIAGQIRSSYFNAGMIIGTSSSLFKTFVEHNRSNEDFENKYLELKN